MSIDPSQNMPPAIAQALSRQFERIVVFSGAGMSADSGIPTFRSGSNGLWHEFDPQDLATPDAWERDRDLVWGWYEWRRGLVMAAQPNPGHLAVAELQRRFGATIVTQNVDDLHERAGVERALHLHGSLFRPRCSVCKRRHAQSDLTPREAVRRLTPPRCVHCKGFIRPGVVWFGEQLDDSLVAEARHAIAESDLLLVVGTSGLVYPAAGLVDCARAAVVIEINPQPSSDPSRILLRWATTAARGLPLVIDAMNASTAIERQHQAMASSDNKDLIERLASSLLVQSAFTAVSAGVGGVLPALLPVLAQSLAQGRLERRVATALEEIQARLAGMESKVRNMSDAQYRLVAGIVTTTLETVDEEKIRLLQVAAIGAVESTHLEAFEAQLLSRILRDISAAEVAFVRNYIRGGGVIFQSHPDAESIEAKLEAEGYRYIDKDCQEGAVAVGLINLGVLVRSKSEGRWSDAGGYVFSQAAHQLLAVLKDPSG